MNARRFAVATLLAAAAAAGCAKSKSAAPPLPPLVSPAGLHVVGNHFENGAGETVQLRGVDRSGTEYMCVQGNGIFDGDSDDASLAAIAAWKVNVMRVPLNEDCWLAINGAAAADSGDAYKQAIRDFVTRIAAHGMAAILELHWNAPGTTLATGQQPMPDEDHTPAFWSDVAATFATNGSVVFDLYNEPYPASWSCWRDGGSCPGIGYTVAGMQELVTTVRGAGAHQPIMLGGIQYANDLTGWLANEPNDPDAQLAASWHMYGGTVCSSKTCWDAQAAPVAQSVPLVVGEFGEHYDGTHCETTLVDSFMPWMDAHGASYLAWTWDDWGDCLSLISSYDGTPAGAWGKHYRAHLGG